MPVKYKTDKSPLRYRSVSSMAKELRYKKYHIPAHHKSMRASKQYRPTFITIHSTGNARPHAGAITHVQYLNKRSQLNKSWHFTVDRGMVVEHVKPTRTTWHAGNNRGNMNSIGIEMCENESRNGTYWRTWDRSAKLTALLMTVYKIRLKYVVPHYYWTRKQCPKPLLDGGKVPGRKWSWFISRVDYYYRCLNGGRSFN